MKYQSDGDNRNGDEAESTRCFHNTEAISSILMTVSDDSSPLPYWPSPLMSVAFAVNRPLYIFVEGGRCLHNIIEHLSLTPVNIGDAQLRYGAESIRSARPRTIVAT